MIDALLAYFERIEEVGGKNLCLGELVPCFSGTFFAFYLFRSSLELGFELLLYFITPMLCFRFSSNGVLFLSSFTGVSL